MNIYSRAVYKRLKWHVAVTRKHILPSSTIFKVLFISAGPLALQRIVLFCNTVIIVRQSLYFSESSAQCEQFVL